MTEAEAKSLILLEVGAGLDGSDLGALTTNIDVIWLGYANKEYYPRLHMLYVKRQCISVLLGQLRLKINKSLGQLNKQLKSIFDNLQQLYTNVSSEIEAAEREAKASVDGDVGSFQQTNPLDPWIINPSDAKYRGGNIGGRTWP